MYCANGAQGSKPTRGVKSPGRRELHHRPGLETYPGVAGLSRNREKAIDDGPADPLPTDFSGCMHRLDFGVMLVESLDRTDPEQFSIPSRAVERQGRIEQPRFAECVHVLRRRRVTCECEMSLDQRTDVGGSRIVRGDLEVLQNAYFVQATPGS